MAVYGCASCHKLEASRNVQRPIYLIVDFNKRDLDCDLPVYSDVHLLKDVVQCPRSNATLAELLRLPRHGVGFASSSLHDKRRLMPVVPKRDEENRKTSVTSQ